MSRRVLSRQRPLAAIGLGAAFVFGLVFRFWTRSPLWLDEALTVNIAKLPLHDIPEALRHDGHPPLYYWLLHGWMSIFGSGDRAVRVLSGLFGTALVPLAYVAGRRVWAANTDRRAAGVGCAVIVALNPFVIRYSTEARMYAMVMVLALTFLLVLHSVFAAPTTPGLLAVAGLSAALLLTHYWSLYLVAVVGILLLVVAVRNEPRRSAAIKCSVAVAGGLLGFAWWIPSMLDQAGHTGTPWARPANPMAVVVNTLSDTGGIIRVEQQAFALMAAVFLVIGLFGRSSADGVVLERRVQRDVRLLAVVVLGTMAIGTIAGYASSSTFISRYASVYMPVILVITGIGVARLADRHWIAGTLIVISLLGGVAGVRNVTTERTQAGQIAAVISSRAAAGDVVVFCPDQLGPAVSRRLVGSLDQVTFPRGDRPELVNWRDYVERNASADPVKFARAVSGRAGTHSVWFVWSDEYRGPETKCSAIGSELASLRTNGPPLLKPNVSYEHAFLSEFSAHG